jgi:FkbM family methyltransferase
MAGLTSVAFYRGKSLLKKFVCLSVVNWVIRLLRLPLRATLSCSNVVRIPIVGEVTAGNSADGQFVIVSDGDDRIAAEIFWLGLDSYETATLSLFRKLALVSNVIFDIGANTGIFALTAATANPSAAVYAFEPVPAIFASLDRNAKRNDQGRLRTFPLAVCDRDGELSMFVPRGFQTFPLTSSIVSGFRDDCDTITVSAARLDTFITRLGIGGIDLLKIDTEATEHLVIQGGLESIASSHPLIVCEVLPEGNEPKLQALLDPLGYKYYWITGNGLIEKERIAGDPTLVNSNYLFVPDARMSNVAELLAR